MCQGVGIRGSACNIDTPVISELNKLNYILNRYYIYILNTYILNLEICYREIIKLW